MKIKAKNLLFPTVLCATLFLLIFTRQISNPVTVWTNSSIELNKFPKQESIGPEELNKRFPNCIQYWKKDIEQQATTLGIDPNLIAAVILKESGGDPLAFSSSGAVGLMQIMPKDGIAANFICNGKPCFQSRPSIQELYDPHFNIEYGTKMLRDLFEEFGNWRDALHSYGPIDVGYNYADLVLTTRDQFS